MSSSLKERLKKCGRYHPSAHSLLPMTKVSKTSTNVIMPPTIGNHCKALPNIVSAVDKEMLQSSDGHNEKVATTGDMNNFSKIVNDHHVKNVDCRYERGRQEAVCDSYDDIKANSETTPSQMMLRLKDLLANKEEKLRKLRMVKMYRSKVFISPYRIN